MKKLYAIIILFSLWGIHVNAQSYNWITGGGSSITFMTSTDNEQVRYMCTDANGNVYIVSNTGALNIRVDTFYRAAAYNVSIGAVHNLIVSYTCDGALRWVKLIEGWGWVTSGGIAYSNGSIYETGDIYTNGTHYKHIGDDTTITSENLRSYTARFDTTGTLEWIRFIGPDTVSTVGQTLNSGILAIDREGFIHNFALIKPGCAVTPLFTTTLPGTYDLKYDTLGTLLTVTPVAALDSIWMITKAVYSNQSDKWYATIQPSDYWPLVHPDWNSAVCSFTSDDSLIWRDTTGINGGIVGIDYKGGNALYVCGGGQTQNPFSLGGLSVVNTIGYANAVIFKLDTNGVAQWVYNLMGNISVTSVQNIAICANQTIAAAGVFAGFAVHGSDTITCNIGQGQNALLIIVDSNGQQIKLDQFDGSGFYDQATAVASDDNGNTFIGGKVASDISATGISPYLSNGGNSDFFVCKYGYNCSGLSGVNTINTLPFITVYPNPATSAFTVNAGGDKIQEIKVMNISGAIIYQTKLNADHFSFRLYESGIYFAQVTTDKQTFMKKLIVCM
ncbi:MAG: T9SS type A sorting domain-containing protein [Bacteroidia bacterium]